MTTTIISTNTIGAGNQFTYAANDDHLIVLQGVTLGSTNIDAIAGTTFDRISLTVLGSIAGTSQLSFLGVDATISIAAGGSFVSSETTGGNSAIFLSGSSNTFTNDGTFIANTSIGVLSGGANQIVNTGSLMAASPVFLGLFAGSGDSFVNSGSVVANSQEDATRTSRFNNAVQVEGVNTLINNLATGTLTAVSSEGAGVHFRSNAGGGLLLNHGEITSVQDFGVSLDEVSAGQALIRVFNWGTISGGDGSYLGSVNADSLVNRGQLLGNVDMGGGDDTLDNRRGFVEGDVALGEGNDLYNGAGGEVTGTVFGGDGNDSFFGNETLAEVFNGELGTDTLDFRFLGGVTLALDNSIASAGSAIGDTYFAFENVNGSNGGDDVIIGSNANNLINGFGGNDVLDGLKGTDILRGGLGVDVLTGGQGNDTFRFNSINEFGDTITDFSSTGANKDDRFQIAAGVGGGLVAGVLAANQFQSRADNVAQDADDRFVFRTTDKTLWFDADGNGSGAAIMVADLQANATMTNLDIVIF